MANTFFAAQNLPIGQSLYEKEAIQQAKKLLAKAGQGGNAQIHLPIDCLHGQSPHAPTPSISSISQLPSDAAIFDIGPKTSAWLSRQLQTASHIFCNGPVGMFEHSTWQEGTRATLTAIGKSKAWSLLGGGDTLSALEILKIDSSQYGHISTGGGALLAALSPDGYACQKHLEALL